MPYVTIVTRECIFDSGKMVADYILFIQGGVFIRSHGCVYFVITMYHLMSDGKFMFTIPPVNLLASPCTNFNSTGR